MRVGVGGVCGGCGGRGGGNSVVSKSNTSNHHASMARRIYGAAALNKTYPLYESAVKLMVLVGCMLNILRNKILTCLTFRLLSILFCVFSF